MNRPIFRMTVQGVSRPKGSLRPITNKRTGKTLMIPQGKHSKPWQNKVSQAAQLRRRGDLCEDTPLIVHLEFYFARPKSHYGTGRNEGMLKADAPDFPITRSTGDVDKLSRLVLDALQGIVYKDDSQVVTLFARCFYAIDEEPYMDVEIFVKKMLTDICA